MAVGAQALAVDKGLADGVAGLGLGEAEHLADDGGAGDLDEQDVVQADLVEAVLQRHAALDLVRLDHALEYVLDRQDLVVAELAARAVGAADPVGHGQDRAKVVAGVAPLGGQPAVIKVEPADHGANVERAIDRVELVGCAGDLRAVGNHGAFDDGAEQLAALGELEGFETAAEGVEEDEAGGVELNDTSVPVLLLDMTVRLTASSDLTL